LEGETKVHVVYVGLLVEGNTEDST